MGGGRGYVIIRDEGRNISQGVAMVSLLAKQHDYNRPGFVIFQTYQCYNVLLDGTVSSNILTRR